MGIYILIYGIYDYSLTIGKQWEFRSDRTCEYQCTGQKYKGEQGQGFVGFHV